MKVDILAFTQGGKRTISFMSQALGLMADLDVGTDNLRWMGESRFLYGLLRGSKRSFVMTYILRLIYIYSINQEEIAYTAVVQTSRKRQVQDGFRRGE